MRITYDPTADAATVYLLDEIAPGGAPRSLMCDLEAHRTMRGAGDVPSIR